MTVEKDSFFSNEELELLTEAFSLLENKLKSLGQTYMHFIGNHDSKIEKKLFILNELYKRLYALNFVNKKNILNTKLVSIESPYAGDVERNVRYAKACIRDCLNRGEYPYASHLFFTQDGLLNDNNSEERKLGMEAGKAWELAAGLTVVYTDLGMSSGMKWGVEKAEKAGRLIEYRELGDKWYEK